MAEEIYTLHFSDVDLSDIGKVGGKNASLGELYSSLKPKGVNVLDGFATTADAFRYFLRENDLEDYLHPLFEDLDVDDTETLQKCGRWARAAILGRPLPDELRHSILIAYRILCERLGQEPELAVRSSATAEDLPDASFAGAAETFLNVRGDDEVLEAIHKCYASLFTDRAINYQDLAVKDMISAAIKTALTAGKPNGICGEAPSDKPGFSAWLVELGISSVSVNPDAGLKTA